jgi:hypothetical protein
VTTDITVLANLAFRPDADQPPHLTLRGGDALDNHASPPPFDDILDEATDAYLEKYSWGIAHLDPASWRHYVPRLIEYAVAHRTDGSGLVIHAFLSSLRPPDRTPARFGVLSDDQQTAIVAILHSLTFSSDSAWAREAGIALEEYWAPGSLYRSRGVTGV